MLNTLIESRRATDRSAGGATASVVLHAALIVLVVAATARAGDHPATASEARHLVHLPPAEPAPPPEEAPPRASASPSAPRIPKAIHVLVTPPVIPERIPPIDLSQPVTNPGDFRGIGAPNGRAPGVTERTAVGGTGTYSATQVEKQAMARPGNPKPRYPSMLESVRAGGSVLVQFVVDTTGRVDMRSLIIIGATSPLFVDAVKRVLPEWKFYPAEVGGHTVRQLVQMPFVFTVP